MAESSRSRSRIRSRSRSRERAPSERFPCAGPPNRESSQDPDTIVITVDMGTVQYHSISLSNFPFTKVWDVKKKIYKEIERIPIKNQVLFFLIALAPHQQQLPLSHLRTDTLWHLMASKMVPNSDASSGANHVAGIVGVHRSVCILMRSLEGCTEEEDMES